MELIVQVMAYQLNTEKSQVLGKRPRASRYAALTAGVPFFLKSPSLWRCSSCMHTPAISHPLRLIVALQYVPSHTSLILRSEIKLS